MKLCRIVITSLLVCLCLGQVGPVIAQTPSEVESPSSNDLSTAILKLKKHITGTSTLDADRINKQSAIIQENIALIGQTSTIISEAFDLVESYETAAGPLFINDATRGGFPRKSEGGLELDRSLFAVQQGLIDYAFTPGNLKKLRKILDGAAFKTSSWFPGSVEAASDPAAVHTAHINASQPACWAAGYILKCPIWPRQGK